MKYLFLDTSSHNVNISIINNNEITSFYSEENDNKISNRIFNLIEDIFADSNIKANDLDKIFIVNGPGSFTGIRVGLTIAKTMAWSLKIPLIPISTLEMMASTETSLNYIIPVINDRNGYVYAGIYDKDLNSKFEDSYIKISDLIEKSNEFKIFSFYSYDNIEGLDSIIEPTIDIIKVINKYTNVEELDVHSINPNYIKRIDAEINLEKLVNDKKNK